MRTLLATGTIAASITLTGCVSAGVNAQTDGVTVFQDVRVFDGVQVEDRTTVVVRDGTIETVAAEAAAPAGAEVIDGEGRTLLPGLIDAHVHTGGFRRVLGTALVFGVTTVLDMAGNPARMAPLREEQSTTGATDRADLFAAGYLVTAPGGHGTQYGMPIPTIESPDQAVAFVDDRIADGSDYIKIVYDAWAVELGPDEAIDRRASIDRATMAAVIGAAHGRDKLAVVHALNARSAREALLEGADGLVHLFTASTEADGPAAVAATARERGAFVIPTVSVLLALGGPPNRGGVLGDPNLGPYLGPDQFQSLGITFDDAPWDPDEARALTASQVERLRSEGVPILVGTDSPGAGVSYGVSVHGEMLLLVELGLTPAEALTAATAAPAAAFGLDDRGRIAPGLRADLVLVDGDPTVDIKATRAIVGIWKLGVPVDRSAAR